MCQNEFTSFKIHRLTLLEFSLSQVIEMHEKQLSSHNVVVIRFLLLIAHLRSASGLFTCLFTFIF